MRYAVELGFSRHNSRKTRKLGIDPENTLPENQTLAEVFGEKAPIRLIKHRLVWISTKKLNRAQTNSVLVHFKELRLQS